MEYKNTSLISRVKAIGRKKLIRVEFAGDGVVYFSYNEPVIVRFPTGQVFVTEEKFSSTTSRHIGIALQDMGHPETIDMPHEILCAAVSYLIYQLAKEYRKKLEATGFASLTPYFTQPAF